MQTLLDQLVYFGFLQSLFLLCIFIFSKKNRKNVNGYIAFLVLALLIGLSGKVLHIANFFNKDFRLIAFSEFATLLFGTTVFLFTRSTLFNKRFANRDLVHYVPSVFYMTFIVFYFMLPSNEVISARIKTGELQRMIMACHAIGLLFNITYWVLSLLEFSKFKESIRNELSYTIKTKFILNFIIAIGVCLFVWVILYIISLFGFDMLERDARNVIWLSIAFIVLFIAYYGMISPEVFRIRSLESIQKYSQSKFTISDLERLKNQLDTLMQEKKPYLNNKLLKAELAEMLGVSNPEIARLLNETIGMNFFEYINYYRIKEFVVLAKSEKARNMTFFGLAQEAGFNSKTTFNKSFKKLMGSSPKEYFNNQSA